MRKLLTILASLVLAGGFAAAVYADAFTVYWSYNDKTGDKAIPVYPSDVAPQLFGTDPTTLQPVAYSMQPSIVLDNTSRIMYVGQIEISHVDTLQDSLDAKASASSLASTNATVSSHSSAITVLNAFKASSSASSTLIKFYYNGATTTTEKRITFSGTTASGAVTFYLTSDGTSGGSALCTTIHQVNVYANDPSNTFGLGHTITNSNKNLNITANVRTFTSTVVLGVTLLGSSSLTASTDGTAIMATVDCN